MTSTQPPLMQPFAHAAHDRIVFALLCADAVCSANDAALLFPGGGFYQGELNSKLQRHGQGIMHAADGAVESEGIWYEGRLLSAVEITTLTLAALSPAGASSSSPPADSSSSECVVCQVATRSCLIDCPHFCMCMDCAQKVDRCPICRTPITQPPRQVIVS